MSKGHSKTFPTSRDVKQCCSLSPLLFSIFMNDLPNTLQNLPTLNQTNKVFPSPCILFADDLVIFAENPKELQNMIDSLNNYHTTQQLNVNCDKTKIMVFSLNPKTGNFRSKLEANLSLMIVGKYKYIWGLSNLITKSL